MVARYEDLQRQTEADAQDVIAIRALLIEVRPYQHIVSKPCINTLYQNLYTNTTTL